MNNKYCPFCGGVKFSEIGYIISCEKCGVSHDKVYWNKRWLDCSVCPNGLQILEKENEELRDNIPKDWLLWMLNEKLSAYPESVFIPVKITKEKGEIPSSDAISADMARFVIKKIIEKIEGYAEEVEK